MTQNCPTTGITAFPLLLSGSRPTLDQYEAQIEAISLDFQWGPLTSGLTADTSNAGYVLLQGNGVDTTSTILHKGAQYKVFSVQIAAATHSNWLLMDPGSGTSTTNKEDLIITLAATDTNINDTFIIIVIPIIRVANASNPAYIDNIGATSVPSYNLGSCLPPKTGPNTGDILFATYSTCIEGYTTHAATQNVYVIVSTSGIQVTSAKMDAIMQGATLNGGPYIPRIFSNISTKGRTSIDATDFPKFITTTRYLTDITIDRLVETRTDNPNQYQCTELDPDAQLDANGNIVIDVAKGGVAMSDIIAERDILKNMVAPTSGNSPYKQMVGTIIGYVMAMLTIVFIIIATYYFFYVDRKDWANTLISVVIAILFLVATILGLVGYKANSTQYNIAIYSLLGVGAGFLLLWAAYNNASITTWLYADPNAAVAATAAATGVSPGVDTTPATTNLENILSKIPVYAVIAALSLLSGFVIGSVYKP